MDPTHKLPATPSRYRFLLTFLAYFLPLQGVLLLIFGAFYLSDLKLQKAILIKQESAQVEFYKKILTTDFKDAVQDLLYLAGSQVLKMYLDQGTPALRQAVTENFVLFSNLQGVFDQVRYLDADGQEVIRIDLVQGEPYIVPPDRLQSKAKRYYFQDSIKLQRGEVYVSPFDLNIEGQEIERPFKPMIRFATPVFDSRGRKRGVLVLNYLGKTLIDILNQAEPTAQGQLMLLNAAGYWLHGPDPQDEWGFMFPDKKEMTFGRQYPNAWRTIAVSDSGLIETPKGIFTYDTVYPLREARITTSAVTKYPGAEEPSSKQYKWKIVSAVPAAAWRQRSYALLKQMSLLYLPLSLILVIAGLLLARARLGRRQAEASVQIERDKLRDILDTMPVGICVITRGQAIEYVNPPLEQAFGPVAGRKCQEYFLEPGTDSLWFRDLFNAAGQHVRQEWVSAKTGRTYDLLITPFQDAQGLAAHLLIFHDITERRRTEAALREMTILQQAILNSANYTIISTTPEGIITTFNAAAERFLGYAAAEVIGKTTLAFLHDPEEVKRRAEELTKELEAPVEPGFEAFVAKARLGVPDEREWTYIRKDGSRYPVLLSVTALRDSRGDLTGFLGIASDITERKQAEEKLRDSEQRFRSLVETTSDWVWELDQNGCYTYASPKIEDLLGYRPDEVIGKTPFEFMPPEEANRVRAVMGNLTAGHQPFAGLENVNLHKAGRQVILETSGVPVFDKEGRFSGYRGIDRDITQRKRAEEDLKFQIQFIETLIETIPIPVFYKDASGRYTGCNHAFEEMFGKSRDEIMGKNAYDLNPKELADKYVAMDRELFERLGTQVYEWKVKTAYGPEKEVIFYKASFTDSGGKVAGLIGVILDITERKRFEESLKQSEEQVRLLLNSTAEGIYGIDLQGNCTFANPSCLRMLGYTDLEQLLGRNMHNLIHHSYPDGSPMNVENCHIYRAFREGRGMHRDDEVLWRADGASFPAEYWSHPQIVKGEVAGAVVTFTDITERKQTEALLAAERQRLANIIEGTNVGTWEWNVQTGETTFNERWAGIIGYTLAELAPISIDTWKRLTHPDDLAAATDLLARHFRKELPYYSCEIRMRHKNGSWVWVLDRGKVAIWTDDGKPLIAAGTHADITARKQAEEASIRLAAIVESSNDAIIGKTLDGTITNWNQGAERMYGYTASEVLGRHISLLTPPENADDLKKIFARIRAGERVEHLEAVRIRKDGQLIDVSLTISPIKDIQGHIIGVSTIARDITKQKQADAELRKLSRAVQESPATVVITDTQGNIEYVNPKFTQVTGYSPEEAIGQNPRILKSGETTPEEYKVLWDTITSGGEWRGFFHNKKKNGELYWESASISPIKDPNGVITNFIAVKEDITAIKEAQDELAKLSLVASKTDNAVIITDQEGLVEWVNDGFTRMTDYTLPEVIGKKPGPILQGPMTDPETVKRIRALLKKQEPFTEEILNYHKDGRPYWVSLDITPILNDRGEVVRFISIQRDITPWKEAGEALRQAKEAADAANRAKSDFLASMSHEIRTPMNAIIGMADLLGETPLTQEQHQYVEVFRSAGETLLMLINDILDLSKVEAGQITLESIDFDLREIVEKVCEVMAFKAHQKGLELACRIMPEVPTQLVGDPVRVRQTLTNLVGNAIKFTEAGEVVVEVKIASEDQCPEDLADRCPVTFVVKDTGIGVSPEKLGAIFEKFTQADATITRKYGGTGLGLAISKHLVELMGGRLQVQSQVGQGSTFWFTIPFARQVEPRGKPRLTPADLQNLSILVVDDNATNRLILREILTGWGAQVSEAGNGTEGLEALNQAQKVGHPFRLVLLDGRMPQMDGFGVAEAIKKDSGLSGMTVMMLTSDARSGDLTRAQNLGIASYLVKPVKRSDLREAINRALQQAPPDTITAHPPLAPEEYPPLRILLADDSGDNRLLIQAYLKNFPFQLDLAENGEQALHKFQAGAYDLVLMDMQMPVMDGYTATAKIREWERQQKLPPTPVLALTAYALKEEIQKSLDAGCTAHLTKPIKKAVLLEAIKQYSRSSRGD